ncbi:MAG: TRAP transporter small permease [Calditrichaeota bacterium]|nr:MAG: TRAP transporter small permease [Calditrichota bacterium]
MHRLRSTLVFVDRWLNRLEMGLIILLLAVMVNLAFLQVVLRNLFSTGILWADIFLRHLVLWMGFLGAAIATRSDRHIKMDVLNRLFPPRLQPLVHLVTHLLSMVVCGVLARAGYTFLRFEIEDKTILFGNVPAWIFQSIIPLGFALISFRFLLKALDDVFILVGIPPVQPQPPIAPGENRAEEPAP